MTRPAKPSTRSLNFSDSAIPEGQLSTSLSLHGDPQAVKFPTSQIKHRDRNDKSKDSSLDPHFDFSYSGIKTAVLRYVETHAHENSIQATPACTGANCEASIDDYLAHVDRPTLDLVASFQRSMIDDLVGKTLIAARATNAATLFVTGGVAANRELRETFERQAAQQGLPVFFPSRPLSTDNAAMIAAAAYPKFVAKDFADEAFCAEAGMVLR